MGNKENIWDFIYGGGIVLDGWLFFWYDGEIRVLLQV